MTTALIIVDVQNDFCPGGALAVPNGDEVVPVINKIMEEQKFDLIVATKDWHPRGHKSFASSHPGKSTYDVIDLNGLPQVLWPDHCLQGTRGAGYHPDLDVSRIQQLFHKGMDLNADSYSGFFDNGGKNPSGLDAFLKMMKVDTVFVVGLATDYCVKATALDARNLGYTTHLIPKACRAVNVSPDDGEKAIREMVEHGVKLTE